MLPIIINPRNVKVILVGDGPAAKRRYKMLEDAGYEPRWYKSSPITSEYEGVEIVFIADFDDKKTEQIYEQAKKAGALVNAEDKSKWCDFNVPAIVRRGDLLLTVSTSGASPRLAKRIRQMLQNFFPSMWSDRLERIKIARKHWKAEGCAFEEVAKKTDTLLDKEGWFSKNCDCMEKEG